MFNYKVLNVTYLKENENKVRIYVPEQLNFCRIALDPFMETKLPNSFPHEGGGTSWKKALKSQEITSCHSFFSNLEFVQ